MMISSCVESLGPSSEWATMKPVVSPYSAGRIDRSSARTSSSNSRPFSPACSMDARTASNFALISCSSILLRARKLGAAISINQLSKQLPRIRLQHLCDLDKLDHIHPPLPCLHPSHERMRSLDPRSQIPLRHPGLLPS